MGLVKEWPIWLVFGGFHLLDLALCAFARSLPAFLLVICAILAQWGMLGLFLWRGRRTEKNAI